MTAFVDREVEMAAFRERFAKPSSLSLLYGRRRVGKTFFLQHILKGNPDTVYFLADESPAASLARRFHTEVRHAGRGGAAWESAVSADWGTLLTLLVQGAALDARPLFLVFDECQYILDAEPPFASVIQRLWDQFGPRGGLHIVLCGSALGVLSRLGDEGQPLYGRFDLRARMAPFDYRLAAAFAGGWTPTERFLLYGVFGGLARHLAEVDPARPLSENAVRAILGPLSPLHEAALDVLRSERLTSRSDAAGVLGCIAEGETVFGAIAARLGMTSNRLDHVLKELSDLEIVRREVRFGDREGSRYTRYRCADPFVRFWFRFVGPNRGALAGAPAGLVWRERIEPRLGDYMGPIFEEIARQAVVGGVLLRRFGPIDEAAPYWSRDHSTEIDLVARSSGTLVFIECKWRAGGLTDAAALDRLRAHVARSGLGKGDDGPRLALISAGGFADQLKRAAEAERCMLVGPGDLLAEG
ncbi:MAG: ATP-binding protein [Deltaproteobacteria bacterium]|nr:ATP-binding protein [Deltaproteobacteria bacterium]